MHLQWVYLPICPIEITAKRPLPEGYPTSLNTLADHIKAKRLKYRLTKTQLGVILGVKAQTIWTWEEEGKTPWPKLMKRIVAWLGYVPMIGIDENTLGGQLYKYRMIHGLIQNEVALMLKIDCWAIPKIERGDWIKPMYREKIEELLSD